MIAKATKAVLSTVIAFALAIGSVTSASAMPVIVKVVSSEKLVTLEVASTDTIESVRAKILEKEGIATAEQLLKFGTTTLVDGKTLADYNIQSDTVINLSVTKSVTCSTSGSFTIIDNVVTSNATCTGEAVLPAGVKSIADNAFYASALTQVTFPSSVTRLGTSSFAYSRNLTDLNFKGLAPLVGVSAFTGLATGAKANVLSGGYGFGAAASSWNGLAVNVLTQPAPAGVTAVDNNGVVTISWTAAAGATNYTVTALPGAATTGTITCASTSTSCSISRLTPGVAYTFAVTATNGHTTSVAANSAALVIEHPFGVTASITTTSTRLGNTFAASASANRANSTLRYTWYRCTNPVFASANATAPVGCIEVSGSTERTYLLPATDIGWFITYRVQATLGDLTVSSIAASLKPVGVATSSVKRVTKIGAYATTAISPTAVQKLRIKGFLVSNPGYMRLQCVGDATGYARNAIHIKMATSRAKAACAYAKSLYPHLTVTYKGIQSKTTGTKARLVGYTLLP